LSQRPRNTTTHASSSGDNDNTHSARHHHTSTSGGAETTSNAHTPDRARTRKERGAEEKNAQALGSALRVLRTDDNSDDNSDSVLPFQHEDHELGRNAD